MSKAKIRSMQRGAQKRSSKPPIKMQDIYKKHPPQLSSIDKPHLDFQKYGSLKDVARIKMIVEAARKNEIDTSSEISTLLNKLMIKTAIGEKWTPRLAWFVKRAVNSHGKALHPTKSHVNQSRSDREFHDLVRRVVKSRLEEIKSEFEASKPTLGDASPELARLKEQLESRS
ncbi:hypothetical protein [Celeribacter sp. ULVN23_4]